MALLELITSLEWGTLRWLFRLILIGAVVFIAWKNHFANEEDEEAEYSEEHEEYGQEKLTEEQWRERERRRRKEEARAAEVELEGPRRRNQSNASGGYNPKANYNPQIPAAAPEQKGFNDIISRLSKPKDTWSLLMFPFELSFEIVEALLEKKPVKQTETAKPVKKEVKEIKKEVSEDKFTEASISPFLMPKPTEEEREAAKRVPSTGTTTPGLKSETSYLKTPGSRRSFKHACATSSTASSPVQSLTLPIANKRLPVHTVRPRTASVFVEEETVAQVVKDFSQKKVNGVTPTNFDGVVPRAPARVVYKRLESRGVSTFGVTENKSPKSLFSLSMTESGISRTDSIRKNNSIKKVASLNNNSNGVDHVGDSSREEQLMRLNADIHDHSLKSPITPFDVDGEKKPQGAYASINDIYAQMVYEEQQAALRKAASKRRFQQSLQKETREILGTDNVNSNSNSANTRGRRSRRNSTSSSSSRSSAVKRNSKKNLGRARALTTPEFYNRESSRESTPVGSRIQDSSTSTMRLATLNSKHLKELSEQWNGEKENVATKVNRAIGAIEAYEWSQSSNAYEYDNGYDNDDCGFDGGEYQVSCAGGDYDEIPESDADECDGFDRGYDAYVPPIEDVMERCKSGSSHGSSSGHPSLNGSMAFAGEDDNEEFFLKMAAVARAKRRASEARHRSRTRSRSRRGSLSSLMHRPGSTPHHIGPLNMSGPPPRRGARRLSVCSAMSVSAPPAIRSPASNTSSRQSSEHEAVYLAWCETHKRMCPSGCDRNTKALTAAEKENPLTEQTYAQSLTAAISRGAKRMRKASMASSIGSASVNAFFMRKLLGASNSGLGSSRSSSPSSAINRHSSPEPEPAPANPRRCRRISISLPEVGGEGTQRRPTKPEEVRKVPIGQIINQKIRDEKARNASGTPQMKKHHAKVHFGQVRTLKGHQRPIMDVHVGPGNDDGQFLFTAAKDGMMFAWNLESGQEQITYKGHNGAVFSMDVSPNRQYVASASADQKVIVWDAASGIQLCEADNCGLLKDVMWSKDSKQVVACSAGFGKRPPVIYLWDLQEADGKCKLEEQGKVDLPEKPTQIFFCPDGTVLSAHFDGSLCHWQFGDGKGTLIKSVKPHTDSLSSFDIDLKQNEIITASADHSAKLLSFPALETIRTFPTDRNLNAAAMLTMGGCRFVIVGGGQDARDVALKSNAEAQFEALLYPRDRCADDGPLDMIAGPFGPLHCFATFEDGNNFGFVSGSEDGCVRIHDLDKEYIQKQIRAAQDASYKSTFPITKSDSGSGETEGENLPPPAADASS